MSCCGRRKEDGVIDRVNIDRAVRGESADLSPTEIRLAIFRLARERHWGLSQISSHLNYSRSATAKILSQQRGARS